MATKQDFWKDFSNTNTGKLHMFDRSAEIIFGLIMVLTFTCSISAASAGHEEIRTILWAALGCNIAWGLVDALMSLLAALMDRSASIQLLHKVQQSNTATEGQDAIKEAMPPLLAYLSPKEHIDKLQKEIQALPTVPNRAFITPQDLKNAGLVFVLVFLSTFPVVIPFIFITDSMLALRVSNSIALVLLFGFGFRLGNIAGYNKWLSGLIFAFIGSVMVWITIMLGG